MKNNMCHSYKPSLGKRNLVGLGLGRNRELVKQQLKGIFYVGLEINT